ncbi:MAG: hypothetical protein Q8P56_04065 [Candidatus Uhrbacteria bacterium]|nr:hypothetical protein [Candidatus Uhrbacteria bacterium]
MRPPPLEAIVLLNIRLLERDSQDVVIQFRLRDRGLAVLRNGCRPAAIFSHGSAPLDVLRNAL